MAVAASKLFNIRFAVDARANDVLIRFPLSFGQTAGAGHVTVPVFVYQQTTKQIKSPFPIIVKKIPFGPLIFFEQIVEFVHLCANADGFFNLLYFESDNDLPIDSNGRKGATGVEQAQFIKQGFSLPIFQKVAINKFMSHFEIREHFLNRLTVRAS